MTREKHLKSGNPATTFIAELSINDRLIIEISNILNIPQKQIQLWDSFLELGGNIARAQKLQDQLLRSGINVTADDVVRCKTIAELQTRAKPIKSLSSASRTGSDAGNSVSAESEVQQDDSSPINRNENVKEHREKIRDAFDEDASKVQVDLDDTKDLAAFLLSASRGDYACLLRAASGPFENQLVAFVSNKKESVSEAKAIFLPAENEYQTIEERIKRFYIALREWGSDSPWPDLWVPLHSMVIKGNGKPATRALQWWLSNLDEGVEQRVLSLQRILSLELIEPLHPRHCESKLQNIQLELSQQEKFSSRAISRRLSQQQDELLLSPLSDSEPDAEFQRRNSISWPQPPHAEQPHQPDVVMFKPDTILEEEEPEDIEVAISEAKISLEGFARKSMRFPSAVPKPQISEDDIIDKRGLSSIRPEQTFSMWIEDESDRLQMQEQMDDTHEGVEFIPLSAMQQLFFRTSMNLNPRPNSITEPGYRSSQSIRLSINGDLKSADVESALETLVNRHSMLRSRFRLTVEGWAQVTLPKSQSCYRYGYHQTNGKDEVKEVVEKAYASINPIQGPVFSADHMQIHTGKQMLFLVAHQLVVDHISWRILIHDLDRLLQGETLLSHPSIPFSIWIQYQGSESSHRLIQPKLPIEIPPPSLRYWNLDLADNIHGNVEKFSFSLNAEWTQTLQSACQNVFRTEPTDLLLMALLLSFCRTFQDREPPTMWTQDHGRYTKNPDFNIDETVGWFTSLCPVNIATKPDADMMELLRIMKDTRKTVTNSSIGFFNPDFLTSSAPFTTIPIEIMFKRQDKLHKFCRNDGVLEPASEPEEALNSVVSDIGPNVGRIALFEISASVEDEGTTIEVLYAKSPRNNQVEEWLKKFELLVSDAIVKLKGMAPELTLSDTPLLKTTYQGLTKFADERLSQLGLEDVSDIETIYPVNPTRQEILIAQCQDLESFHLYGIYEFSTSNKKPISQGKLYAAWYKVVALHTALRSIFIHSVSEMGLYDQVVLKKISPDMLFLDSEQPLETLADLPVMRFVPGQPRHRLSVCKTATKTYIRLDASQAICDSISIDNLITKLKQAFSGEEVGDTTTILDTYLCNVKKADTSQNLEDWRTFVSGMKPCAFPTLTSKPENHHKLRSTAFDLEVTRQELYHFCTKQDTMSAYVLQLAWALVLRAYVGMSHVHFGYEVSGRDDLNLPGIKGEIGSFAALLPCGADLGPNKTILDCLQSLADVASIARRHQNPTMTEIQHAAGFNTEELFNTCLSMRDFENARHSNPGLDNTSFRAKLVTSSRGSNCDLSVSTMFIDDHLHIDLTYRHITSTQAEIVARTFERAIQIILENVNRTISEVDLLTNRDYAQLILNDSNPSPRDEKVDCCVHQLALRHAQTRPDAQAICSWDGNMTYHQMAFCVSTLGSYLRNIGVCSGLAVPAVMGKSKWSPIIMLAILKAGGSIVCLDAQDRNTAEATIKQLNPRIVLATKLAWKDIVCVIPNLVIINERFFSVLPPQVSIPIQEPSPDHGACVFYSPVKSKSGLSRSLFFTHSSLCSAFIAQGPALKLGQESRVLQLSAFNLDISLVEVLGTMVHGGCVCVPSPKDRHHDLAGSMARMGVTWSYMTCTLARRIDPQSVPSLKTICFRTRSLDEDTRKLWKTNRNILLAYGAPDICPLGISIAEISDASNVAIIPPPLMGRFLILSPDNSNKLVPHGAVGELAIDCPFLTPHKFVKGHWVEAHPPNFAERDSQMKYLKTGHHVRYLDDGSIQFLSIGKVDTVINGQPVPIADIEQHLRRLLHNIDVVVESVTTIDHIQLLAAFLEIRDHLDHGLSDVNKLRKQTKERSQLIRALNDASTNKADGSGKRIAAEHVPSAFIPLKQFPLSSSLKVNRRKLQKMVSRMSYSELIGAYASPNQEDSEEKPLPSTDVEELMRNVWSVVLGIPPAKIKSHDSFFGLGGSKYLATKLVVACRNSSLTVSLADLLNGATLTDVCQAIVASDIVSVEVRTSQLKSQPTETFEIPGFDRTFIKDHIAPQMKVPRNTILDVTEASVHQIHGLETRLYGNQGGIKHLIFNFNGPIRLQRLQTACETLTCLHPIFRTAFSIHDRHVYQVLLGDFGPEFQRYPCPAWCLKSVADNVITEDQEVDFKPEEPLSKFTFLDAGQQSTLLVRLCSSQIDEVVVLQLVQDLAALYEGSAKVSRKSSFFDYMRAAHFSNQSAGIDFWRQRLESAKMTHFVAHNKPYPPASDIKTVCKTIQIDSVAEFGLSFSTVLKAAWAITLAQYAACSDVIFGEVAQGPGISLPNHFDMTSMLASTTNIIPVRVNFSDSQYTPLDFMRLIQEDWEASRPHEALGVLELVQRCTNWSYWTRFSTVVHHRCLPPVDGTTTLNIGGTTFTHTVVESSMQDIPDILVISTVDGPQTVNLELKYSESRVPTPFAKDTLRLLAIAVGMITSYDTIKKPMIQSASEIMRSTAKIPLAMPPFTANTVDKQSSLPNDDRQVLQSLLSAIWTQLLNPKTLGVPDEKLHKANFFDLWGSVLPAHAFADEINAEFAKQPIKGINKLSVTPKEIIDHPSMAAQYDLIVGKMAKAGLISSQNSPMSPMSWKIQTASGNDWAEQRSLRKAVVGKLKTIQPSGGGVRELGSKAGLWMRRRRSGKHDSTSLKGFEISEPIATALPPRAVQLQAQMGWSPTVASHRSVTPSMMPRSITPTAPNLPMCISPSPVSELSSDVEMSSTFSPLPDLMSPPPIFRSGEWENESEPASPISTVGAAWMTYWK